MNTNHYNTSIKLTVSLLFCFILNLQTGIAQVSQSERQALIDLYNATNGDNWKNTLANNKLWKINDPNSLVRNWWGVTVETDNEGKETVTKVALHSNGLNGELPSSLNNLTGLLKLDLASNNISGTIPEELGQLSLLQDLFLNNNKLTGNIPSTLGNILSLINLSIINNSLTGSIPLEIGNLSNLRILSLERNQLSGAIPSELANLKQLQNLNLDSNNLSGTIPAEIGDLDALQRLSLQANQLSGSIPLELGNLSNLGFLFLSFNNLSGTLPLELGNLTNLRQLEIENNAISGEIPSTFGNLGVLGVLRVANNKLEGALPSGILVHQNMGVINVANNNYVFSGLESFKDFFGVTSGKSKSSCIPQAKVDQEQTLSIAENASIKLSSEALTSLNNNYQWYKDGVVIEGATNKDYVISNANASNDGVYHFIATNSTISGLALERNPITLTVEEDTCGVSEEEKRALWDLYIDTNGSNWKNTLANDKPWDLNIPVCDWYGIEVIDGKVTSIDLRSNNLSGNFPSSIFSLEGLSYLNFGTSDFLGNEIPAGIGNLQNLKYLNLSVCNLTGSLPVEIGNLIQLESIILSSNKLTGNIPSSIGNLLNLEEIYFANNLFSGSIPQEIENLSKLRTAYFSINKLSGEISSTFLNSSVLQFFWISNNEFIFSDITEPLNRFPIQYYAPQAKVDTEETLSTIEGGTLTLTSTELTSPENAYQWYKNGFAIDGATSKDLVLTNISLSDAGEYHFIATNDIAPGLTLKRNSITLEVKEDTCKIPEAEKQALWDLYLATDGPNWKNTKANNKPWDLNIPVCQWYGVTVSGGSVYRIMLDLNDLRGVLPSSIGNFTNIQYLILNMNPLSGSIPDEMRNLTNLRNLSLRNSGISGGIPSWIGELNKLGTLELSQMPLGGTLPESMRNLKTLYTLRLNGSRLEGELPDWLGEMTNLGVVYLSQNNFTGDIPVSVENWSRAKSIFFHMNQLSGKISKNFLNATTITTLRIDNNRFVFSDIDTSLDRFPTWHYSPQAKVDESESFTVTAGQQITLSTTALTSPENSYQWFKDGVAIDGATDKDLVLSNPTIEDSGVYFFKATNSIVTGLTLERNPITLAVEENSCGVSEVERQALIDIYNATNGENWNNTWDLNKSVCEWYGVVVSDSKVVRLQLNGNGLTGSLPNSINGLKNLKNLWLHDNQISGNLPDEIGNLSEVIWINITNNNFSGSIPESIGGLAKLERVYFSKNNFSGTIPQSLSQMPNLYWLNLGSNQLSGTIPSSLSTNANLVYLFLPSNNLSGEIPAELGNLRSLERLVLHSNQLSGTIPQEIGNLTKLKYFYVFDNQLSGRIPDNFATFTQFKSLRIQDNQFIFSDLEPTFTDVYANIEANNNTTGEQYIYVPQAKVDQIETYEITEGDPITLTSNVLVSSNNSYQWFKDGVPIPEATNKDYVIENVSLQDQGVYHFLAANSIVTRLKLERNPITLVVNENTNPGGDNDCNILEGVVDGTFESCTKYAGTIGTSIYRNDLSCSNFETPSSQTFLWKTSNIPGATDEIHPGTQSSPDGDIFVSCRVDQPQSAFAVAMPIALQTELSDLEVGAEYEISFYQSNGGFIGATIGFNAVWNVILGRLDIKSSEPMLVQDLRRLDSEPATWSHQKIKFIASETSTLIRFSPSAPNLGNVDNGILFHLLIDGIKINKVGSDCGDGSGENPEVVDFCFGSGTVEYPIVYNLIPHGDQINWYLNETGGEPIPGETAISIEAENPEGVTYWWDDTTDTINERTPVVITINGNVPAVEEFQSFSEGMQATVADLVAEGDVDWYLVPSGGNPLPLDTPLEHIETYFADAQGASCRSSVTVFLETSAPSGDGYQTFCNGDTLANMVVQVMDGSSIVWYNQPIGGITLPVTTLLEHGNTYYAAQVDSFGVESEDRKEITANVVMVSPPYVPSTLQRFYANESHTIGDLLAIGYNIKWFDQPTGGLAYSDSELLIDGETYYADQESLNGCSGPRQGVLVRVLDEDAPVLFGCEKFKPAIGDKYVVNAWVREQGITPVNPDTRTFNGSPESELLVGLLNHLKDKITNSDADLYHIPDVYLPQSDTENLNFDGLMPYVKDTDIDERKVIVYGFKPERNSYGHVIGFSFALNKRRTSKVKYLAPFVRKRSWTGGTTVLNYRYPITDNTENLTFEFTDVRVENEQLIIFSDFKMENAGVFETNLSNIRDNDSGTTGIEEEVTFYEYQEVEDYQPLNYINTLVKIEYSNENGEIIESESLSFEPKGSVIDGWQKVSGIFTIPIEAFIMKLSLMNTSSDLNVYYDDIRFQPYSSAMKTFVYDPITQRLKAELDENNFATFYEYDKEGGLIRVKKETERGVYTIQETRSGNSKLNNTGR